MKYYDFDFTASHKKIKLPCRIRITDEENLFLNNCFIDGFHTPLRSFVIMHGLNYKEELGIELGKTYRAVAIRYNDNRRLQFNIGEESSEIWVDGKAVDQISQDIEVKRESNSKPWKDSTLYKMFFGGY